VTLRRLAALCATLVLAPSLAFAHAGVEVLDESTRTEVAKHPESADAHIARARVLQMKGEWDGALEELEAAAARGADPDAIGEQRAMVYLDAKFPRMAKVEIDRVLARRPDAYGLLFERGRAWLAIGDANAAARDFGEAIAKGPRPTPEQVIARRDALVSVGKKDEAIRALDEGMTRVGQVVSLVLPAIDLEVELGRYDAALARLDRLSAGAPPNPLWQIRRADILEQAGRKAEARAEYANTLATIDARPPMRRGKQLDELRRRVETALASTDHRGDSQ
jgi:tetratricopeptide (TPR) repeat protein